MRNTTRFFAVLSIMSAAVASQALSLTYTGFSYIDNTPDGGGNGNLTSLGLPDDFNFTTGYLDFGGPGNGWVKLGSGADYMIVTFMGSISNAPGLQAVSAVGTVDGFGIYNQFDGQSVTVTTNTFISAPVPGFGYLNFTTVLGELTPVPEPASMAATAIGAVCLLRRRQKRA